MEFLRSRAPSCRLEQLGRPARTQAPYFQLRKTVCAAADFPFGAFISWLQERERRILESRKTVDAQRRVFAEQGHRALDSQPDYLKGEMMVVEGVACCSSGRAVNPGCCWPHLPLPHAPLVWLPSPKRRTVQATSAGRIASQVAQVTFFTMCFASRPQPLVACCSPPTGGTLRDYQLDGLNWMVYSWSRGQNGILAGAMTGLLRGRHPGRCCWHNLRWRWLC